MPFLRRRGVMASEGDMRRHTTFDPMADSGPPASKPPPLPQKSLAEPFLSPDPAHANTRGATEGVDEGPEADNPVEESSSFESNGASVFASAGRPSEDPFDRPESPPVQEETVKHRRFSIMRFRNASDSQLSTRMKTHQPPEQVPPMPQPPAIITTAPTVDAPVLPQKKSKMKFPRIRKSTDLPRQEQDANQLMKVATNRNQRRQTMTGISEDAVPRNSENKPTVTFQDSRQRPKTSAGTPAPPPNHSARDSQLVLPGNRLSDSERSDRSSNDHIPNQGTTATLPTASTSTFFRLPRRKPKQPEPLFPLSHLPQKSKGPGLQPTQSNSSLAPRESTSAAPTRKASPDLSRPSTGNDGASSSHMSGGLDKPSGSPATALFRPSSRNSGQPSPTRPHPVVRGRSSTFSSLGRNSVDERQPPGTTRASTSTGRKSFGDLLGLSRLRQNPETIRQNSLGPGTPGSNTSKNNSLQLNREKESVVLPERREDDTPAKYLARIEDVLSRGVIASALSKGTDPFSASVLRSYMRTFGFFEEPMDMAIRKLLMEAELPKETQQIDRCLQAFANRYHECNPGIYSTPDQAYFIAFSLLILHTDVFNKNNKYKMQKPDYLKNTSGEGIFDDVLECFYDNITYTPFIHVEDDLESIGERSLSHKMKKKAMFPNGTPENMKRSKDPIDPYTLILDGKLDTLRPPLKDQIPLEEHYSYLGTAKSLNLRELQQTFFKTGVLQIVSARSRPDAFMTEKTATNPQEAHPGIVDIKITKVGTVWRKDPKKKKARSPWQEWGAILTGAQLYFFRNTQWIKSLVHQYETHVKQGQDGIPLIFKPPLEHFKPDALMSTDGAVALFDSTYKKHKNSFVYVRHGGLEEVLLAQSEEDRNDWLAKLNYAAAFRTSGVRMRGLVGSTYEGQSRRAIRRLESSEVTQVIHTPSGEVSINRSRIDHKMAQDILTARRTVMEERIAEADEKLQGAQKHLEAQLRNARHLLILAPIQEKTREQVRGGAAKIMAQLKWSRTEYWRLKCHRDILAMDLEEEKALNGDLEDIKCEEGKHEAASVSSKPSLHHTNTKGSSHKTLQPSPHLQATVPISRSSETVGQLDGESSPVTDVFQTPPTSATIPDFQTPQSQWEVSSEDLDDPGHRKPSIISADSSGTPAASTPPPVRSSPAPAAETSAIAEPAEEDAGERQILEQTGLLEIDAARTPDQRPDSSHMSPEDTPNRHGSTSAGDKDRLDRNKLRRSLQRTLREGAHLSHHRSKRGKDSASSGGMSDETMRDDVLSRGNGSFVVHGKKASVVNFGAELQHMTNEERIRQRKASQSGEAPLLLSPTATEVDLDAVLVDRSPSRERRGSNASASTATARSFRELHRKYSTTTHRAVAPGGGAGGLVVPSDEDSDAALSFSDGRHTPLPPVEDGSGDEEEKPAAAAARAAGKTQLCKPDTDKAPGEGAEKREDQQDVDRLPSPPVQTVTA